MAKKPTPRPPDNERFGDWSLDGLIPLEPGQILVNDDPEGDPYKFARNGHPDLVPRNKPTTPTK